MIENGWAFIAIWMVVCGVLFGVGMGLVLYIFALHIYKMKDGDVKGVVKKKVVRPDNKKAKVYQTKEYRDSMLDYIDKQRVRQREIR